MISLSALRRYAQGARRASRRRGLHCELCGVPVEPAHPHVVDRARRALRCACRACALLFMEPVAAQGRYQTVPDRILWEPGFTLSREEWSKLEIPVRLAFFFFNSSLDRWVALYPSPAGATEAEVDLDAFEEIRRRSLLVRIVEPDVEALIAYAPGGRESFHWYLVPIDRCYELVARIRTAWSGVGGGPQPERLIRAFFERLVKERRSVESIGERS